MFEVFSSWFMHPSRLIAAVVLIPLIAVYLIRPKPTRQTIPSLMFLMRDKDKSKLNSLFRALFREFLLFLHVLCALLLIAAIAQPFLTLPHTQVASDTVIVLDDSAALYAVEGGQERFRKAQALARESVGRSNTILLAGSVPRVGVEDASADRAREYISSWRPSHQPVRLSASILAAQEFTSAGGRVVVISTFQDTDQDNDFRAALATLRSQGIDVSIRQVGTPGMSAENIGIVDIVVGESETRVEVQNYFDEDRTVQACVGDSCTDLPIRARDVAQWRFVTPPGTTQVRIDTGDAFSLDDQALILTDARRSVRTLVVTNQDFYSSFLYFALSSIERSTPLAFEFEINTPPQLVDVSHDLVIFYEVDPELLVGRTVREAAARVRAGGAVIVMAQDSVFSLGLDEVLLLSYEGQGESSPVINTQDSARFAPFDFGFTPEYVVVSEREPQQVLARASDGSPLISLASVGQGRALYYGLPSEASFSLDPLYPVFWRTAVNALLDRRSPADLNLATGQLLSSSHVTTPSGRQTSGTVLLTSKGVYETAQGPVVANVLHPRVSDTSIPVLDDSTVDGFLVESSTSEQDITRFVVFLFVLLLLAEIAYLKWRGDA